MKTELKKLLAERHRHHLHDPARTQSAVLIPLFSAMGQYHIVFIKRTQTVKAHKGQISFPGGGRDAVDITLQDTAVREAYEEIGLLPEDIEILGDLDNEITTTSNYIVTPYVAMIPWPYKFKLEKAEVDELFTVPVSALMDKNNIKPAIETLEGGIVMNSYNYLYEGRVIWGATARILQKFLEILVEVRMD